MKVNILENASSKKGPFKAGDIIQLNGNLRVILLYISDNKQICLSHYKYEAGKIDNWAPFSDNWELFNGEVTLSND